MGVQRNGGVGDVDDAPRRATRVADEPALAEALERAERAERRVRELEEELASVRSDPSSLDSAGEGARGDERSKLLEAVFDAMTDGVIVYDRDGHMLRTNPANREILGNEAAWNDYFARPIEERLQLLRFRDESGDPLLEDQWPHLRILRGETLAGTTAMRVQGRDLHGRDKHLIITGAPLRDAAGNVIGAVCIHRDVTERHRLREEAARRASLLEAIFEAVPDRISLFDEQGQLTRMNSAAQRSSGPDRGGERLDEFQSVYSLRKLSGEPYPMEELPVTRSLRGEIVTSVEMLYRCGDGRDEVILTNSAPITDPTGKILGVVSITHDITALRQAEQAAERAAREVRERAQRTRESLDALLQVAHALVQPSGEPSAARGDVHRNEPDSMAYRLATLTCAVLGCTRVSLSVVESETALVRPLVAVGMSAEDTRRWFQEQEEHPARLGEGAEPDVLRRFLAGEVIVLDMTKPPYDSLPNPYHITTVLTVAMRVGEQVVGILALDHSGAPHSYTPDEIQLAQAIAQLAALAVERGRLIKERSDAAAQTKVLEETNRRMSEFLSIASHELRTPLTSAIANSQLARREIERWRDGERGDEHAIARRLKWLVSRTEQQLQRQSRLVTDLLDVSRIEVGRLEMECRPHDLLLVARECVEEQRLAHPLRVITLRTPGSRRRIEAMMDADRIGQALTNFLTNALKYSPPEASVGVRVSVSGGKARVAVRDQGPGLPPEERERVWQRFHRAPGIEVLSGSGVGLGIGLYISRTIIERHSGSVGVESAVGQGSTFWFEIPCLPDGSAGREPDADDGDGVTHGGK